MKTRPLSPQLMSRREALLRMGTLVGGAMVGMPALLSGCASRDARPVGDLFAADDAELLDWVAETILPATDTPGAMAAQVGAYMMIMVADTYTAGEQAIFLDGLESLQQTCIAEHGIGFVEASSAQRSALLERLDSEQYEYMRNRRAGQTVHYFRMLKELSLSGYFTSEIGYRQAMRYIETPGRFDPCVPYAAGDRAWAPHA